MGGWIGGQACYVMVPYADFNLLKFPDKDEALSKIMDLTMLTDILPTGFHGALTAGVKPGSTVYVAGAGPIGHLGWWSQFKRVRAQGERPQVALDGISGPRAQAAVRMVPPDNRKGSI